jgi:hypothetical protein
LRRRRFDHLTLELSLALDRNLPRYPLWLAFKELGVDPDYLTREVVIEFCDEHLSDFLAHLGHSLSPRKLRRLQRAVARFDPELLTPYERMARI